MGEQFVPVKSLQDRVKTPNRATEDAAPSQFIVQDPRSRPTLSRAHDARECGQQLQVLHR